MKRNWTPTGEQRDFIFKIYGGEIQQRIICCTEACASIPNPAAVADAVAALRELVELLPADQTKTWHKAKAALAALETEAV